MKVQKNPFKSTLETILVFHEKIKENWKKGYIEIKNSDINDLYDIHYDDIHPSKIIQKNLEDNSIDIEENLKKSFYDKNTKSIFASKKRFKKYIQDIEVNINLLRTIKNNWFSDNENEDDPKLNEVSKKISFLLKENPNRKIIIFTMYADTAEYITNKLKFDEYKILLYTGKSSKNDKNNVRLNFDASVSYNEQKNDLCILVTTDALSEWFNLNRDGVLFNYDIPYNPTRIIQRIVSINRINK